MDIVRVFNGLGNQMSQYAFYLAKKQKSPYQTCWIFLPDESASEHHNGYELDRIFGIKRDSFKEFILRRIYVYASINDWRKSIFSLLTKRIREQESYDYDPSLLHPLSYFRLTFLFGGWHSEKYFQNIKLQIKDAFTFDEKKLNDASRLLGESIKQNKNSCSIHIRRGDYLQWPFLNNVATLDYYQRAISYVKNKNKETTFYVFSNDIKWCRQSFGQEGFVYVECNQKLDSWQDMYLMSLCHNHINANSTFSWWGAWLSKYSDSLTIVPTQFRNDLVTKDIYPDNWIKL